MKFFPYLLSFLVLFLFQNSSIQAQANTLVIGKIQNHNSLVKRVELRINNRYVNNEVEVYESNLLKDGTFAFAAEIKEPQYATVRTTDTFINILMRILRN